MSKTVMTVTEVNQDFSRAQRAVGRGPVVITHRGEPAYVLMSYKTYVSKSGRQTDNLLERLHVDGLEDIDVDFPALGDGSLKPADLA